jgi:hypothetical protein
MDRRDLLKLITLATGGALIGGDLLLSACSRNPYERVGRFSAKEVALLDDIAETILPRTSTPGAKDAAVGPFMAMMVEDVYFQHDQEVFEAGLETLRTTHRFAELDAQARTILLNDIDEEARRFVRVGAQPAHYFTMMKQLALLGFFTSEVGMTQVLRYLPVPGKYDGNFPYAPGDRAWAI